MQELIKKLEIKYRKPISEFDYFDWTWISIEENLSEDFIRKYHDKLNWTYIPLYQFQNVSEDFLREFDANLAPYNTIKDFIKKVKVKYI